MRIGIIGGGASGLMCAIKASKNSNNIVTIYEKNNKCGKKILITGNGRCNYFNNDFNIEHYNSYNKDILNEIINETNKEKILNIFNEIGIIPKIVNDYYYPMSGQAITIKQALELEAIKNGVKIITDVEIENIEYNNQFIITSKNNNKYYEDKIVLATGSKSAPKTGSDGIGYDLARSFGHSIIKPLPALVQLVCKGNIYKKWTGIRTDVEITLYEDGKRITSEFGEIQLTDYGISGICVFQLSGKVVRGLNDNKKEEIKINFLPWLNQDIKLFLDKRNKIMKNRSISELLDGLLNYKLVNIILEKNKIDNSIKYDNLSSNQLNGLINDLICFNTEIIDSKGFESSQVTSGGIPLTEININTFESIKHRNLYIIGELLDVDGNCGGFNLGFAWISGIIAGENI